MSRPKLSAALWGCAVFAVALLSGCGTSPDHRGGPVATSASVEDPRESARAKAEAEFGPSALPGGDFWPGPSAERVAVTDAVWTRGGELVVGYADGLVARVSPERREVKLLRLKAPVQQLSPTGELALVATEPPSLLHLTNGEILLNLNQVQVVEGSAFTPDGALWFVADNANQIHVWSRERLMAPRTGEDIRDVLRRELPDYSATFESVKAPLLGGGVSQLMFSDTDGTIYRWDTKEQEIWAIVRLPGVIQSVSIASAFIAVTSDKGQMRLIEQSANTLLPWTYKATGSWVALLIGDAEPVVALVDGGELSLRESATGAQRWSRPFPSTGCGVFARSVKQPIALCADGVLALIDPTSGALQSTLQNRGGQLIWLDPDGASLIPR